VDARAADTCLTAPPLGAARTDKSSCWRRPAASAPCAPRSPPAPTPSTSASSAGAPGPSPRTSTAAAPRRRRPRSPVRGPGAPRPQRAPQGRRARAGARGRSKRRTGPASTPSSCTDLAFAARVRERYPDLALHASTQLDTHSVGAARDCSRASGSSAAILARELSLDEIAALEPHGLELEVFAHGALCYGYSGDCLLSSMVGGRSGNRGRCSQSCRLRYSAPEGRRPQRRATPRPARTAGDGAYALDCRSLRHRGAAAAARRGRDLVQDRGPHEGRRLRRRHVAVYREALDAALADPDGYSGARRLAAASRAGFSRGFTERPPRRVDHHEVRSGGRGGHRGVPRRARRAFDEAARRASRPTDTPVPRATSSLYTPCRPD
jgi:hypothetical protein